MPAQTVAMRRSAQPQYACGVLPEIKAEFSWIAGVGSIAGKAVTPVSGANTVKNGGIQLSGGYAKVSGAINCMHTTVWTEIGSVYLDTTNSMYTLSARSVGQAVNFQPGASLVDLVMWGVADINISGALPVGLTNYVASRNGSNHSIWINGRLYGTASSASTPGATDGTLPAIGAQAGSGASQGLTPLVSGNGILAVTRTPIALPDAVCRELSANPWQLFSPRLI